jgi:hypothetical protein
MPRVLGQLLAANPSLVQYSLAKRIHPRVSALGDAGVPLTMATLRCVCVVAIIPSLACSFDELC